MDTEEAASLFVNATSAHNDWLQLLVEGGPLAVLALLLTLVLGYCGALPKTELRAPPSPRWLHALQVTWRCSSPWSL